MSLQIHSETKPLKKRAQYWTMTIKMKIHKSTSHPLVKPKEHEIAHVWVCMLITGGK